MRHFGHPSFTQIYTSVQQYDLSSLEKAQRLVGGKGNGLVSRYISEQLKKYN